MTIFNYSPNFPFIIILALLMIFIIIILFKPKTGLIFTFNNKSLFTRLITGLKKGLTTNTLPDNILKIHTNPLIRIFRVFSGFCAIYTVSQDISNVYLIYF